MAIVLFLALLCFTSAKTLNSQTTNGSLFIFIFFLICQLQITKYSLESKLNDIKEKLAELNAKLRSEGKGYGK